MYLEKSSTTVRKYRCPWIEGVEIGPQTSMCIRSKAQTDLELLVEKGNRFCFANGQIVQVLLFE